jgi:HK97 family phage prohead protease
MKQEVKKLKHFSFLTKAASDKSGVITLVGYANKNIIDGYNERVEPMGANLERFKKNPILLFNHDMDYPIGRVLDVELRDDGVYVTAEIAPSDSPKMKYVYDLVKSGILRTFSIGFTVQDIVDSEDKSHMVIKAWTLLELSVVSIPANEDSTFEAQVKAMAGMSGEQAAMHVLQTQGAILPAKLLSLGVKHDEAKLATIAKNLNVKFSEVADLLTGRKLFSNDALAQFIEQFGIKDVGEELARLLSVQECVAEKIPQLISEGKPVTEAIAEALAACEDKGDKPNDDNEKSQNNTEAPQAEIPDGTVSATVQLDLIKAQTAMMGDLVGKTTAILAGLEKTNELLQNMLGLSQQSNSVQSEGEENEPEQPSGVPEEEAKRYRDSIEESLKRLGL